MDPTKQEEGGKEMEGAMAEPRPSSPLVLLVSFPSQGHINPMVQFAKRLAHHGIHVRHVTTPYILRSLLGVTNGMVSIPTELISDGFDEFGFKQCGDIQTYLYHFRTVGSRTLDDLLDRLASDGHRVSWIVYDSFLPWVLDVAKPLGIHGAALYTQLGAVGAVYYLYYHKKLDLPPPGSKSSQAFVPVPGVPVVKFEDLPSFMLPSAAYSAYLPMLLSQFSNTPDWFLLNSVDEIESSVLRAMAEFIPYKPIGPMLPLPHINTNHKGHDTNLVNPHDGYDLLTWLDGKPPKSVVYAAFGSIAELEETQALEILEGLKATGKNFIFVRRPAKDPRPTALRNTKMDDAVSSGHNSSKPMDRAGPTVGERGLFVGWCSQIEVLSHESVGCFVSHCGWNSTSEGLSLGVPMVCLPWWSDQAMNAMFVEEVWGVGLRTRKSEKGSSLVEREEVERCVREIMEGEKGKEIRGNSERWKEVIRRAVVEGGSSDRNLKEFVGMIKTENS